MQWACFQGQGYGHFDDLDQITMFADYRVPQVLVHFGAMSYDDELMQLLHEGDHRKQTKRKSIDFLFDYCFLLFYHYFSYGK